MKGILFIMHDVTKESKDTVVEAIAKKELLKTHQNATKLTSSITISEIAGGSFININYHDEDEDKGEVYAFVKDEKATVYTDTSELLRDLPRNYSPSKSDIFFRLLDRFHILGAIALVVIPTSAIVLLLDIPGPAVMTTVFAQSVGIIIGFICAKTS
jgi:tRNA G37 N-methylase Trm5